MLGRKFVRKQIMYRSKQPKSGIAEIILENFKAFGARVTIPLLPLTVLSGSNSSGKSSIYQSLLLLDQSIDKPFIFNQNKVSSLLLNGNYVKIGNYVDVLHDINNTTLTIGLRFNSGIEIISSFIEQKENSDYFNPNINKMMLESQTFFDPILDSNYEIKLKNNYYQISEKKYFSFSNRIIYNIIEDWIIYNINNIKFDKFTDFLAESIELPKTIAIRMHDNKLNFIKISINDVIRLIKPDILAKIDVSAHKKLIDKLKKEVKNDYIDLYSPLSFHYDFLTHNSIIFIPPFRGFPKRYYNVLENECFAHDYNALQMTPIQYRNVDGEIQTDTFRTALDYWIGVFFGIDKKFKVEKFQDLIQVVYLEGVDSKLIPLNNLGFGVGQVLPILYKCLSAKPETLLIIDEPETHLHPSLQSKLADFFIQMALFGRKIIIETHSEYIIDKLIYHCIKSSKAREATGLYWVTNNQGNSKVEPVFYDDLGYVINAPEGFLSEKVALAEELATLRFKKLDAIG
jgi:predicted ATPase